MVFCANLSRFSTISLLRRRQKCLVRLLSTIPHGLLAVYKPCQWTSTAVVQHVRKILEAKMDKPRKKSRKPLLKVGHGGTLDPMAEGVLILGIGTGTTVLQDYLRGSKRYYGVGLLGSATDTLDATGTVVSQADSSQVTVAMLSDAAASFEGDILQMPPMYSALQQKGVRLYVLARRGLEVQREARAVHVSRISIDESVALPYFGLNVQCGGGVYIRTLIADIAVKCGSVAHMTALRRTQQGPFRVEDCLLQEDWNFDSVCKSIIPLEEITSRSVTTSGEKLYSFQSNRSHDHSRPRVDSG